MLYFIVSMWFYIFAFLYCLLTYRNYKKGIIEQIFNEIAIIIMMIVAGVIYPYIYKESNMTSETFSTLLIITATIINSMMIFLIVEISYVFLKHKEDKIKLETRKWCIVKDILIKADEAIKNNPNQKMSSNDISRKALHLINPIVISVVLLIVRVLDQRGILSKLEFDNIGFSYWLVVTIAFAFMLMFAIGDFFRLYRYEYLPKWARKVYYKACAPKEYDSYCGVMPIVIGLVPFLFTPIPILIAVTFLTSFADAMASVIGKKYGKRHLSKTSKKTVIGLLAGGLTTFLIVLLVLSFSVEIPIEIGKILLMATVSASVFMILDLFTLKISDNILNPLIVGGVMTLLFYIV